MKINKTFKNGKLRLTITIHMDRYSLLPESTMNYVDHEGNRVADINVSMWDTLVNLIKFKRLS